MCQVTKIVVAVVATVAIAAIIIFLNDIYGDYSNRDSLSQARGHKKGKQDVPPERFENQIITFCESKWLVMFFPPF